VINMSRVHRVMVSFSEENLVALQTETEKRNLSSIQFLIREIIRENLGMELPIVDFRTDELCPQCKTEGQLVEYSNGKIHCLNCS
jgi:uncharacterized metal-binding protein YceD (DUF177 family)